MKKATIARLHELRKNYEIALSMMEGDAKKSIEDEGRAYGGFIRSVKGKAQEYLTEQLIFATWIVELGQRPERIKINSDKVKIPITDIYISKIKDQSILDLIKKNKEKYYYGLSVDKHVFIDDKFIAGVECKAYTENAMIKRILVDFMLLKTKFPGLDCFLFQLESQLGGDYSSNLAKPLGSQSTHSIMSYFPTVELKIVTLLEGERKVDRPINKLEHSKELKLEYLMNAVEKLSETMKKHI